MPIPNNANDQRALDRVRGSDNGHLAVKSHHSAAQEEPTGLEAKDITNWIDEIKKSTENWLTIIVVATLKLQQLYLE